MIPVEIFGYKNSVTHVTIRFFVLKTLLKCTEVNTLIFTPISLDNDQIKFKIPSHVNSMRFTTE